MKDNKMRFLSIIFLLLSVFVPSVQAGEVGSPIPNLLTSVDQNEDDQSFDTLRGENGVVLFFVRSVDWCPYCQRQVMNVANRYDAFKDAGYEVVVISYDSPAKTRTFAAEHEIPFLLLSDEQSEIINSFGILDTSQEEDSRFYGIPKPTIFVVDETGRIKAKFAENNYRQRPDLDVVIKSLK